MHPFSEMDNSLFLRDLTLEITKKCPLCCLICSSNCDINSNVEFTFPELKKIINDAVELRCESIAVSGGEPLIYPKIVELCEYLKKKGVVTTIYTCGNIINNGKIQPVPYDLLLSLKEIGIDKLIFSIHGGEKEHEQITDVKGSLRNLLKSIEMAKSLEFKIELHFVPTKMNYKSLPDVVSIAEKLSIDVVSLLRFVPQGRGAKNRKKLEMDYRETMELKRIIEDIMARNNVCLRVGAHYSCLGIEEVNCTAALEKATILPEGYVVPCPSMKELWDVKNVPNVKNTSLSNIWYGSEIFIETRSFPSKIYKTPCARCKNFDTCKGGCPTQRILLNSRVDLGPDPLCSNKSI